jgi:hypothetical protein
MVAHQAVAIELKRLARFQVGNRLEKGSANRPLPMPR